MYHWKKEKDAQGNTRFVLYWIDGTGNKPQPIKGRSINA